VAWPCHRVDIAMRSSRHRDAIEVPSRCGREATSDERSLTSRSARTRIAICPDPDRDRTQRDPDVAGTASRGAVVASRWVARPTSRCAASHIAMCRPSHHDVKALVSRCDDAHGGRGHH